MTIQSDNIDHEDNESTLPARNSLEKQGINCNVTKEDEIVISSIPQNKFTEIQEKLSSIDKTSDIKEILNNLKEGIKDVISSGKYQNYLNYMSSFYTYSVNNTLLIWFQKPEATLVGSYGFWQQKNRYIKKDEHGIKILAPTTGKREIEKQILDKYGNPVLGDNNTPLTKKEPLTVITGFKWTTVFDISQTKGDPVPSLLSQLEGNSKESEKLINVIQQISVYPIRFGDTGRANGYFDNNEIVIKENMSSDQTAKTMMHEYTHSELHNDLKDYAIWLKENRFYNYLNDKK